MDAIFKEFLNGIFANNIPPMFLELVEDMSQFESHFGNSNDKYFNLFTALRTVGQLMPKELSHKWNSINQEDEEVLKKANRAFWTSMYLELQNMKDMHISDKYDTAVLMLNIIEDSSLRMNGEILTNQTDFTDRIKRDIKKLKKEKKRLDGYTTIYLPIPDEENKEQESPQQKHDIFSEEINFEMNPIWKHGIGKLTKLSIELYEDGFTSHADGFKNIFNRNSQEACNWLKRRTALLYLLGLLISKNDNMPDIVVDLICKRVLFKNKETTRHTVKTQLLKIQNVFNFKSEDLQEQYSEIFHIHHHIF